MNIKGHFETITRHKLLVMKYCFACGLYEQGLAHDLSKYSPTEFIPGGLYYPGAHSPNAASRIYLGDRYTDASPWEYYDRSKGHYMLHPETRALLEKLLKMVRDLGQERTFAYMKFLLGCQTDY